MPELTECDKKIIRTLAKCSLNVSDVSRELYMHRNTVVYHIEKIERVTDLNPLNFYDLTELLKEGADK